MLPSYEHLEPIPSELDQALRERLANHNTNGLFHFRIKTLKRDYCCLTLDYRDEITNGARSKGTIHGSIVASLVDTAGAFALATGFEGRMSFATVDLHINFLARAQTAIDAHALVIRRGNRINVCDVNVLDENKKLVAKAGVNFILTKPPETKP